MDIINKLLGDFFHIPHIGLILAGILIAAGSFVIAAMLIEYWKVRSALASAISIISEQKDEQDFTDNYETVRSKLENVPGMKHTWSEFEETLIPPIDDIDDQNYRIYRNTKRPSDYFSATSVHHFQIKAFIQPHTFVGLGLLFTFLGLVAALTETGQAFASPNVEGIQNALQDLLKVAGTKFWASVGGLLTSIVVGAAYQSFNASIRKRLHTICNLLEERLLYANLERIAVDQYGHAQRQTRRLEEMSTEITLALGDRIHNAMHELPAMLSTSLGETMQPVTDELKSVTQNMGQDNHAALKEMADEFAKNVTGSSHDAFNNVNNQLEQLVATLEVTAGKLSGGGDELRSGLEGAMANINQTMLQISDQLKETTASAGSQFKSDAESASTELREVMLAIKEQQASSVDKITQLTDSLEKVGNSTSDSINQMIERSGNQLGQVVQEAVGQTSSTVSKALENLGDDVEGRVRSATTAAQDAFTGAFSDLNTKLIDTSDGLTSAISEWKIQLNQISQRFESISGQLNNQVQAVAEVNRQVEVTGNSFAQSAQSVRDASQPLNQVTSQLNQASEKVGSLLSETLQSTQKTTEAFDSTLTTVAASVESLEEAWETNGKHLKNVDAELENAFRQITNHMSSSLEQLSSFSKELDTGLSSSLEQLSGFVMDVRDLVEEFAEAKATV